MSNKFNVGDNVKVNGVRGKIIEFKEIRYIYTIDFGNFVKAFFEEELVKDV
jgi:hypothetical protein